MKQKQDEPTINEIQVLPRIYLIEEVHHKSHEKFKSQASYTKCVEKVTSEVIVVGLTSLGEKENDIGMRI